MKKVISLLSALAIISSMAVTASAAVITTSDTSAQVDVKAADSKPEVQVSVLDEFDEDGYIQLGVKLVNNEALSFSESKSKYTSNGINAIQIKLTLDSNVFDTTETYVVPSLSGCGKGGEGTENLTFTFTPGAAVDLYMTTVPEYLFTVSVLPASGNEYDEEALANIPNDAVTFGACQVEYKKYAGIKAADALTAANAGVKYFYTIYNVNAAQKNDYPLTVKFTGTAAEGGEEGGEDDVTAEAMAAGVLVEEGVYAGMTSASTDKVAAADLVKIEITNDVDTSKTLTWNAPTTLGDGKTNVLAVLLYNATDMKGSTFTVKFLGAADALIKAFTHIVE